MNYNVVVSLVVVVVSSAKSQPATVSNTLDSLSPVGQFISEHIDKFACPEYYQRKELLRSYQRRGYADIVFQACSHDGLAAVIDYLRMQLQIEYSLNHELIYCKIPLMLDWKYPVDPWKEE